MFINEMNLYIDYLKEQVEDAGHDEKRIQYCIKFAENVLSGISYYKSIEIEPENASFSLALENGENQVNSLMECVTIKQK